VGQALLGAAAMSLWTDFNDAPGLPWEEPGAVAINHGAIATFLEVVFGYCDGLIPVRGFVDQGQGLDTKPHNIWIPADRHAATSLSAYATWAAREGSAVYVIPGTVAERGEARAEHVLQMQAAVVDLDAGDIEGKLAHLVQHLGPPTLLVESGGRTAESAAKLHAWWRLFDHATGRETREQGRARQ
jgi:hypothetical protein